MVEVVQAILTGFFTGMGAGLANWLLIRRLETIEKRIQEKINELSIINGKKKQEKLNNEKEPSSLAERSLA